MRVRKLEVIQYPTPPRSPGQPRFGPRSTTALEATFPDIEAAIRRLDRDEWPYVWLHAEPGPDTTPPDNVLQIMGGRREYAITLYRNGDEIEFVDRSRKDGELVAIWESDQGSERWPRNLCNDVAAVIQIAQHFYDHGELPTDHQWQVQ